VLPPDEDWLALDAELETEVDTEVAALDVLTWAAADDDIVVGAPPCQKSYRPRGDRCAPQRTSTMNWSSRLQQ
jgi:hypothetical protein